MSEATNVVTTQEKKDVHTFKFSYSFLILDYILRWLVLALLQFAYISETFFWICQFFIIPFFVSMLTVIRVERMKTKYKSPDFDKKSPQASASANILTLLVFLSGLYISYTLLRGIQIWKVILILILIFLLYGAYMIFFLIESYQTTSIEERRKRKEEFERKVAEEDQEAVDANDIRIVAMEAEISSVSQRVESYTLESALFGALAFSGFLTLIASDKPVVENVKGLLTVLLNGIDRLVHFHFDGIGESLVLSVNENNIIGAITLFSLISSMFFLSVIVSRLRFYEALRQVDYAVKKARAFNDKEEAVYNLKLEHEKNQELRDSVSKRLNHLTGVVTKTINDTQSALDDLRAITSYVRLSRNLGIFAFLVILVLGALLFSARLALTFVLISILAAIYGAIERYTRNKRQKESVLFHIIMKRLFNLSPTNKTTAGR